MKIHTRTVLANPNSGLYCHSYRVDRKIFVKAVKGLAIPRYNIHGVDKAALYLRAADAGGYEHAALHLLGSDTYYIFEYSRCQIAA